MKSTITRFLTMAVVVLTSASLLNADILVSVSFSDTGVETTGTIAAGTATVDGYLHFDAIDGPRGDDAGAAFDAFNYAIEATEGVAFEKPITLGNLDAVIQSQNWGVADQSEALAENQIAGNANAPGGSGLNVNFGIAALKFTVDTSRLVAGDVINFDPNLAGFFSLSNGSDDFGGNANYVFQSGSLSVSAVPEPASGLLILAFAGVASLRRRR